MSDSSTAHLLIRMHDVNKVYRIGSLDVPVLRDITLAIHRGEYVTIMGASGSGKSTLMNILGCLDQPSSGEYYFDGLNIEQMDDPALSIIRNRKIGFVFQNFSLLPRMTARENIEVPMIYSDISHKERKKRALEMLDRVGLSQRSNHRPSELSGGQKQRVAIARALVNHPQIILADEPTGNLDSKTSVEIMEILQQLHADGNTIVLVTHDDTIARYASRIIHIKDGEIGWVEQVEKRG